MDYCPKIIPLPRSDCAICFAGYTGTAYPLMSQLAFAITAYGPSQSRAVDIKALRAHALKIFDSMASSITADVRNPPPEIKQDLENPAVDFIFGGYSWIDKEFDFYNIGYDRKENRFLARNALHVLTHRNAKKVFFGDAKALRHEGNILLGRIAFGGDQGPKAKEKFLKLMSSRLDYADDDALKNAKIDMEPFEVLRDMLRDEHKEDTIGGAPQLVKIYEHMNTQPVAVRWPNEESVFLLGRPLLPYEHIDFWILDPDTLLTSHPKHSKQIVSKNVCEPSDAQCEKPKT